MKNLTGKVSRLLTIVIPASDMLMMMQGTQPKYKVPKDTVILAVQPQGTATLLLCESIEFMETCPFDPVPAKSLESFTLIGAEHA